MKIKRVMIAAPKSGSGKTTITCALLPALKKRGLQVLSYKCGPDYIDPMFHERAIGVPAQNLDTFFTGEERTGKLFLDSVIHNRRAGAEPFAVMEGVMGLYDGLGGVKEEGSSYHLAKVTKTPILLVVDAKGMGRSVVSLIAGFLAYDKERLIRGVILNRISEGYYERIKPLIEEELKLCVAGFLPERAELHIGSRHLGLIMPDELEDIREKLRLASEIFEKTVRLEAVMEIAEGAGVLEDSGKPGIAEGVKTAGSGPVIAVARDEAFCFYYEDNLRLLKEYGAKICYFSPLRDTALPRDCHALLLGGGYPELYAAKLSGNRRMRGEVRQAAENGMPVAAECGGFLYLHTVLKDKEGISYDMAGVIPAACFYTGKSVRFGYLELREKQGLFWPKGERIKGHEFHYYDSTAHGAGAAAVRPATGKEYSCMIETENCFMGFPHLYYPSNPAFAKAFVEKAERYRNRGKLFVQNE
ncbi:MAG: cobyrinate a,c-diamide synthase [Blautia sp.]|nr:cobyrinate a,c-diamide synthase [Blautia sp.]MCM1202146.1 cobyrinate a,c-diamide synthase [Bacteroides fragilis]